VVILREKWAETDVFWLLLMGFGFFVFFVNVRGAGAHFFDGFWRF
jgi:hypothetical protein